MFSEQDSKDFIKIAFVILALAVFGIGAIIYFIAKLIF